MKERIHFNSLPIIALSIIIGIVATCRPAEAGTCVPQGADVYSATLSVYADVAGGQEVRLHRITTPWTETEATWDTFGGGYDSGVAGSFVAIGRGWQTADVTELVQAWVDGAHPNYGVLLEQDQIRYSSYKSSESSDVDFRPKLEICYSNGVESDCITIQRPDVEQAGVADGYIWAASPAFSGGDAETLYTGSFMLETQSLVRFEIELCMEPEAEPVILDNPGTSGPGYWKTHPEAWPVDEIVVGGITYTRDEAISLMWMPVRRDMSVKVFRTLVSAKLNMIIGNEAGCVADAILAGDDWMERHGPVGSRLRANRSAWKEAKAICRTLAAYNWGWLCAPRRAADDNSWCSAGDRKDYSMSSWRKKHTVSRKRP